MKGTSTLIEDTEAWAEWPLTPSLWPLPPHSRPPTPYWTPRQATAGTDVDDQAGWSGVRRGGFPQESAPRVPLSLLETPNSGHLGPLDKHQDGLPNPRHRPDLNWVGNQAPVPPLPHPFTVSLSPLDGSGGALPREGTNKETAAVPSWPSDAPVFPMSCSTQAAMKQDSLCLLNKGACGSLRWP